MFLYIPVSHGVQLEFACACVCVCLYLSGAGRIMAPKDVLIPRICECIILYVQKDLADMNKVSDFEMGRFSWLFDGSSLITWVLQKWRTFPGCSLREMWQQKKGQRVMGHCCLWRWEKIMSRWMQEASGSWKGPRKLILP